MAEKDFRHLFEALRGQCWQIEMTSSGHYRLTPPDKTRTIVHISTSSGDTRIMKNVLRDLRASGFEWPWKKDRPSDPCLNGHKTQTIDEEKTHMEDLPVRETEIRPAAEPAHVDDLDVDALFRQLKDARSYASMAKEARDEAQLARDRADAALKGCEKEHDLAVEQLRVAKEAFDSAFAGK